jgi:hypothetical protein
VVLPVLLWFFAILSAGLVAYGTHPALAQFSHGLQLIQYSRHLQWPLLSLSLVLCITVIALVVSGRRRAWWLIGLAPVLALFVHRFHSDPIQRYGVVQAPGFVAAGQASFLAENDYIVGLRFNGSAYAYPYATLYTHPVIFQADHDQQMVLIWSAFANRAIAYSINRALHPRDVEIVSMPNNSLLLYNAKLGQFIHGVTGCMGDGRKPTGFQQRIATHKMRWCEWLEQHPGTRVLVPQPSRLSGRMPNAPLRPFYPMPPHRGEIPADTRIVILDAPDPVAIRSDQIGYEPLNLSWGNLPLLVFRDPASGQVRAFERRVEDLSPRYRLNTSMRRKGFLVDQDSNSGWSAAGRAIEGQFARENRSLKPLLVDEGLQWGVMRQWYPQLQLIEAR